ncbi:MAG: hypothetical protein ACRCX1_11720, partial [Bacteroidales bacterium]
SAKYDDTADSKILKQQVATANDGSKIEMQKLHYTIEARIEEILLNVGSQIDEAGFSRHQLEAGIIIIGGASQLKNLPALMTEKLGMDVRKGILPKTISIANAEVGALSGLNIVAGLLMMAKENCSSYVEPVAPPVKEVKPEVKPIVEEPSEVIIEQPAEQEEIIIKEPKRSEEEEEYVPKKPKEKHKKSGILEGIGRLFSLDD